MTFSKDRVRAIADGVASNFIWWGILGVCGFLLAWIVEPIRKIALEPVPVWAAAGGAALAVFACFALNKRPKIKPEVNESPFASDAALTAECRRQAEIIAGLRNSLKQNDRYIATLQNRLREAGLQLPVPPPQPIPFQN